MSTRVRIGCEFFLGHGAQKRRESKRPRLEGAGPKSYLPRGEKSSPAAQNVVFADDDDGYVLVAATRTDELQRVRQRVIKQALRSGTSIGANYGKLTAPAVEQNRVSGTSDMAGKAARVAVEPSWSERDTMERLG